MKKTPHQAVPIASIKGKPEREAVMKLNDNIASLDRRIKALEDLAKKDKA